MRDELVVIDAAHGGQREAGRSSAYGFRGPRGTLEKDVTLELARRVAARLGSAVLTRSADVNRSLAERLAVARERGAAVFVSLHAGGAHSHGARAFVHPRANAASWRLGEELREGLGAFGGQMLASSELAVLAPEWLPEGAAACLIEIESLADRAGEERLRDGRALDEFGEAIARSIHRHLERRHHERDRDRYGRVAALDTPLSPNQNPNDVLNAAQDAQELAERIRQMWQPLTNQAKQALLRQLREAPGSVVTEAVLLGAAGVGVLLNTRAPVPKIPAIPLDFLGPDFAGISIQPVVQGPLATPSFVGFNVILHERRPPRPAPGARPSIDVDDALARASPPTSSAAIAATIESPDLETETPGMGPDSNMDSTQNREELVHTLGSALLQEVQTERARPWVDLRPYFPTALPYLPNNFIDTLRRVLDALVAALPDQLGDLELVNCRFTIGGQERWIPVAPTPRAPAP